MKSLMRKELKLSANILSYLFIAFGLMFLLPGYPVLCGAFFVTLGIFQSFQSARETNDILFSALLPIAKHDVVKGKYLFVCAIELCALWLMAACAGLRMSVLSNAPVYRQNALMNANGFALGMACVIFTLFNAVFVRGFFKTVCKLAGPFVMYIVLTFITIIIGEALHYVPGLEALNAFGTDNPGLQLCAALAGMAVYVPVTYLSYLDARKKFEKIDL